VETEVGNGKDTVRRREEVRETAFFRTFLELRNCGVSPDVAAKVSLRYWLSLMRGY
jgi:hypothetical protein